MKKRQIKKYLPLVIAIITIIILTLIYIISKYNDPLMAPTISPEQSLKPSAVSPRFSPILDTTPTEINCQVYSAVESFYNKGSCVQEPQIQPQPLGDVCGNSIIESGEECDDGGICTCPKEGDCINTFAPVHCSSNYDCNLSGEFVGYCQPYSGDGCDEDCQIEIQYTPYTLKWQVSLPLPQTVGHGGVALGDLDGDGKLEAVFSSFEVAYPSVIKKLHAVNYAGNLLWEVDTPSWVVDNPALGDLDGDGKLEIVVGTTSGLASENNLLVYNHNGTLRWTFPTQVPVGVSPALVDLDGDGRLEILFGTFAGGVGNRMVYSLNYNGSVRWSYQMPTGYGIGYGIFYASPVVDDIDGDGNLDILIASDNWLYSFDKNGTIEWTYQLSEEFTFVSTSPAVADFDNDGKKEIVFGSSNGGRYIQMLNYNGSLRWEIPWQGTAVTVTPAIADVNLDGNLEILIGSNLDVDNPGNYAIISSLNKDGIELWNFRAPQSGEHPTGFPQGGNLAVADINNDGYLEILLTANDPGDYPQGGKLFVVSHNGVLLWNYNITSKPMGLPVVADIEKDGHLEILFGTSEYANGGKMISLTQPGKNTKNPIPWPMFGQNLRRTSFLNEYT